MTQHVEAAAEPRPGRTRLTRGTPRAVDRFEAAQLRAAGLTNKQIGTRLGANAEAVRQALMTPEEWKTRMDRQRAVKRRWWRNRPAGTGTIVGRTYLENGSPVTVLIQWGLKRDGYDPSVRPPAPRNVLIERADGSKVVRPFRGLRRDQT